MGKLCLVVHREVNRGLISLQWSSRKREVTMIQGQMISFRRLKRKIPNYTLEPYIHIISVSYPYPYHIYIISETISGEPDNA